MYIAAQSYPDGRCVLAIGDTGVGVPNHLRSAGLGVSQEDKDVLLQALDLHVTGTGNPQRGLGFYSVLENAEQAQLPKVALRIWSGCGRVAVAIQDGKRQPSRVAYASETIGTWIRLEFEAE